MDLFILDDDYNRASMIEEYESAIWTERFTDPGDMRLVTSGTLANYRRFSPGTLIGLRGSKEVMILEDRLIEDSVLTVNGKTIEHFFDERFVDSTALVGVPGEILGDIVNLMQDRHSSAYAIPRLRVGLMDDSGVRTIKVVNFGPVHTALLEIAKKYSIGMSVEWTRVNSADRQHELVFTTRKGVDRSRHQTDRELVRFSPDLDNFANVKELLSVADSKTTVIARFPDIPTAAGITPIQVTSTPNGPKSTLDHFQERILEISCEDITEDTIKAYQNIGDHSTLAERQAALVEIMTTRVRQALASNKKVRVIDGEITPASRYKYGKDYLLGDSVDMQGYFGDPVTGIITEYIRSEDGTGERSYPTVAAPPDDVNENVQDQ